MTYQRGKRILMETYKRGNELPWNVFYGYVIFCLYIRVFSPLDGVFVQSPLPIPPLGDCVFQRRPQKLHPLHVFCNTTLTYAVGERRSKSTPLVMVLTDKMLGVMQWDFHGKVTKTMQLPSGSLATWGYSSWLSQLSTPLGHARPRIWQMRREASAWLLSPASSYPQIFRASQLRPQMAESRDKPSLLCPLQTAGPQCPWAQQNSWWFMPLVWVVCYKVVMTGIPPNLPSYEILDDRTEFFFFFLPDPVGDQLMCWSLRTFIHLTFILLRLTVDDMHVKCLIF